MYNMSKNLTIRQRLLMLLGSSAIKPCVTQYRICRERYNIQQCTSLSKLKNNTNIVVEQLFETPDSRRMNK